MATHRYSDGYRSFREADPARQVAFEVLTLVRNEDAYANLLKDRRISINVTELSLLNSPTAPYANRDSLIG